MFDIGGPLRPYIKRNDIFIPYQYLILCSLSLDHFVTNCIVPAQAFFIHIPGLDYLLFFSTLNVFRWAFFNCLRLMTILLLSLDTFDSSFTLIWLTGYSK